MIRIYRYFIFVFLSLLSIHGVCYGNLSVSVIDVGEGQAVLLQEGDRGILIDTGSFAKVQNVIDYLKQSGVVGLNAIFLTHLHSDHASGIFTVMNKFPNVRVLESGKRVDYTTQDDSYRWITEKLDQGHWDRAIVNKNDTFLIGSFSIQILWPPEAYSGSLNNTSLVLLVECNDTKMLIMGDATHKEEKIIFQSIDDTPHLIDILVVGHHGASDATSEFMLKKVKVKQSVISVNRDNIRGYPGLDVVKRLREVGDVHITSMDGHFKREIHASKKK